jgi:hypothetical protein
LRGYQEGCYTVEHPIRVVNERDVGFLSKAEMQDVDECSGATHPF